MNPILQLVIGMLVAIVAYNPIAVMVSAPFHYAGVPLHGIVTVLIASGVEIILGIWVMMKQRNYRRAGIGIILGAIIMTFFMFLLTPLLGV